LLVGEKPPTREPIAGLYQDAFTWRGEILELARKPSRPLGPTGSDAFGKQVVFEDLGDRTKALLNFGMNDVDIYGLTPLTAGVRIVGGTSNYTVCDVTDCPRSLRVGVTLDFRMAYSAMSKAMLSPHALKILLPRGEEAWGWQ
jgi:predicted amino acid racemase